MSISAIFNYAHQSAQSFAKEVGKYSFSIPALGRKVNQLAIPAIVLFSMSTLPGASAGPVAYALCVTDCLALTLGAFAPACLAACAPFLAAPTP